jgi:uncharacterized repeat protein (TIGR04138 family)
MNQLQAAGEVLDRIRNRSEPFDERAYLFVLAAVQFLQTRLPARRHVTGVELAWACRDFALEQFGLLAPEVLAYWGVRQSGDFGRIVYALVDIGLLITRPGDREEDFEDVYQFTDAFDATYVWQGVPSN